MGRKSTDTVDFFPHFVERGKTIFILKNRFGNDGYAIWFQLLELLCSTEGHCIDCRDEHTWQYLLAFCDSNPISVTEILDLLAALGKIDKELWKIKLIWCPSLTANLEYVYRKRGRAVPQKPVSVTETPISVTETPISVTERRQSKAKHSKEKKLSAFDNAVEVDCGCFLTKKKRRLTGRSLEAFEEFWKTFSLKKGKAEAGDSWLDVPGLTNGNGRLNEEKLVLILEGARREAKARPDLLHGGKTPKWAQGWLSGRRWEDETAEPERGGWE